MVEKEAVNRTVLHQTLLRKFSKNFVICVKFKMYLLDVLISIKSNQYNF
jgi:hypothetical protein